LAVKGRLAEGTGIGNRALGPLIGTKMIRFTHAAD
jgi:hypothetical protein